MRGGYDEASEGILIELEDPEEASGDESEHAMLISEIESRLAKLKAMMGRE